MNCWLLALQAFPRKLGAGKKVGCEPHLHWALQPVWDGWTTLYSRDKQEVQLSDTKDLTRAP